MTQHRVSWAKRDRLCCRFTSHQFTIGWKRCDVIFIGLRLSVQNVTQKMLRQIGLVVISHTRSLRLAGQNVTQTGLLGQNVT